MSFASSGDFTVAKYAFSKCGRGSGKSLTVTFVKSVGKQKAQAYKKLLTSKGMSGKVAVQ